jgi:hypothetical protein
VKVVQEEEEEAPSRGGRSLGAPSGAGRHAAEAPAVTARTLLPTDRQSASISSEK